MKELRIQHQGNPIHAFFAFNPSRRGIMLCSSSRMLNTASI
ncbi:toxin-antitoxin system, toxin component, RelE domain protein [Salmonella enterica subsp. houtenae str. ATCC BAA-1581]|nr:toxin-antitoxin system, toxin component, RelE domain protein [Salmonella enterica subsp. houtenae str. ATCC BAA-1581]